MIIAGFPILVTIFFNSGNRGCKIVVNSVIFIDSENFGCVEPNLNKQQSVRITPMRFSVKGKIRQPHPHVVYKCGRYTIKF